MSRKWSWCWMAAGTVALAHLSPWCAVPVVVLLGGLFIHQRVARMAADARLRRILFGSYGLQVLVTLGLYVASANSWPLWTSQQLDHGFWRFAIDAAGYHINALRMLDAFWAHQPLPTNIAAPEFVVLLTAGYVLVGPAPLLLCLLNAWLRAAATLFAYALGRNLLDERAGRRAALLVGFWPSLFIWGSQLLREILCLTVLFGVFWGIARMWRVSRVRFKGLGTLAVLGLGVVLLTQLRWYLTLILFVTSLSICVVAGMQRVLFHRPGVWVAARVAMMVMLAFGIGRLQDPLRWLPTVLPRLATPPHIQARAPEVAPNDRTTVGAESVRTAPLLSTPPPSIGISPTHSTPTTYAPIESAEQAGPTSLPVGPPLTESRWKPAGSRSGGMLTEHAPFSALTPEMLALWRHLQLPPRVAPNSDASQNQGREAADREPSELGAFRLQFASWQTWRLFSWVAAKKADNLRATRDASLERAYTLIAPDADTSTTRGLLTFLPQGIVATMLSPWPTQWFDAAGSAGVFKGWSSLEVLLIYLLLPSILIGLGEAFRRLQPVPLGMAVFSLVGLGFLSLTVASVGVIFRLRLGFLLPLAILGCAVKTPSRWLWYLWFRPSGDLAGEPVSGTGPVRIVRILTRLNIGGPSLHAALLSIRLDPNRFSTCLVIGTSEATEGDVSDLVQDPRVRLIHIPTLCRSVRPLADLRSLWRLLQIIWRERPRIIHTHMAKAGSLGRLAGLIYNWIGPGRKPAAKAILIHTFHGHVLEGYFSPSLTRLFVTVERWLARQTDGLIAVSSTVRDDLLGMGIGRLDQWSVIPLGLDLSSLGDLPLPNGGSVRFGMVGRLVPIKNPSLFVSAFDRLVQQRPARPVSGVIVGDGPLRLVLEQEVKRLGLDTLLQFTGWQRDLRTVYAGLEATCLTSWNEGTPVALIEAMAAGRTVIATDVGGVRDLLEGDRPARPIAAGAFHVTERGILVRAGDAVGLASALAAVARDEGLRRQLGSAARSYALQHFGAERLCRDMTVLYEELLAA